MKHKTFVLILITASVLAINTKAIEYEYDSDGNITKLTYDSGGYTIYNYDTSTGKVHTETYYKSDDTQYMQTSYTYYQDGSARKDINVYDNSFTRYWEGYYYDSNGNLETEQSERVSTYGRSSGLIDYIYTYNNDSSVATKTNTNTGDIWKYTYNDDKTLASETAIGNTDDEILSEFNKKVYTYNQNGTLQTVEFYNNKQLLTKENYDSNGILVSIATTVDGESNANSAYSYMEISDPYNKNQYFASVDAYQGYYNDGQKAYETYQFHNIDGDPISYTGQEWDNNGRLIYSGSALYGDNGYDKATYLEYDENGNLIEEDFEYWDGNGEEYINGYTKYFEYDLNNKLARETIQLFDANGLKSETISKYDSLGYKTVYQDGKKVGIFDPNGNPYQRRIYTIDEANRVAGKTNTFSIRYR